MYMICRDYLPEEALYMIRYHSCYPIHREGAYDYLLTDHNREKLEWVKKFNPYDLYSKGDEKVDVAKTRPYYEDLIREFFPEKVRF
jgi:inositol oxygenase